MMFLPTNSNPRYTGVLQPGSPLSSDYCLETDAQVPISGFAEVRPLRLDVAVQRRFANPGMPRGLVQTDQSRPTATYLATGVCFVANDQDPFGFECDCGGPFSSFHSDLGAAARLLS